ncbi:IS630 family transposase, partial [Methylobacterium sp. J-070]|nr:IS630 family transposase [Methylobacterium sp. J-070]
PEVAARVVALTQGEPPGETTHWTAAAMAKAASISVSSVQRIWRGHGQPASRPSARRWRRASWP